MNRLPREIFESYQRMDESDKTDHGEIILYQTGDGYIKLDVRLQNETLWLTQASMAELFRTTQQNISLHIQNVYEEGELTPDATYKDFLLVI